MTELEKKLTETVTRLEQENELLRQKIDLLVRKVFGKSSEQLDLDQLLLFEADKAKKPAGDDPEEDSGGPSPQSRDANKPRKRKSREATLPENLPTEQTTLIPDEVKQNPGHYRQIGEETTVKLDYPRSSRSSSPAAPSSSSDCGHWASLSTFISPHCRPISNNAALSLRALPPRSPPTASATTSPTTASNNTS